MAEPIAKSRRYRITSDAIRILGGLYILREKVIRPVIAGAARPHPARPPQFIHPIGLEP